MKKIIILTLLSFFITSCGTRKTEMGKHEVKISENIEELKIGQSNLKLSRNYEGYEKQSVGKMQLSILSNKDGFKSNTDNKPCENQRKVLVKDSQGNSAEMLLNDTEDISFGSEINSSEILQNYNEALSDYKIAKEDYKKSVTHYEFLKNKKTESDKSNTWIFAILLVVAYIVGMLTLPLVKIFIESKIRIKS